jgi:hypothetical protein
MAPKFDAIQDAAGKDLSHERCNRIAARVCREADRLREGVLKRLKGKGG